jgi:hypothetical protein
MGLNKRSAGAEGPKDTAEASTFFAAGTPPAPQAGSKTVAQAPEPQAPAEPLRTFFDTTPADPIFSLSTHRAVKCSGMTAEKRAARKEAEEARARTGLECLMSFLLR